MSVTFQIFLKNRNESMKMKSYLHSALISWKSYAISQFSNDCLNVDLVRGLETPIFGATKIRMFHVSEMFHGRVQ